MQRTFIIFGASRDLGTGLAAGLPVKGDKVFLVSRSRPEVLEHPELEIS